MNKKASHRLRTSHHQNLGGHKCFKSFASQEPAFASIDRDARSWEQMQLLRYPWKPHTKLFYFVHLALDLAPMVTIFTICASNLQHSNFLDQLVQSCGKELSRHLAFACIYFWLFNCQKNWNNIQIGSIKNTLHP
jgi:hypothetical protein